IENAIAHADEISRKVYRESLKNNVELIRQSRQLVSIACDMPIKIDLTSLIYESADRRAAYELFSELEFEQLVREYSDAADTTKTTATVATRESGKADYTRVTTAKELDSVVESLWTKDRFGVAIAERKGWAYGLALAPEEMRAALVDFERFDPKQDPLPKIKEVLENGLVHKAIHDWKGVLTSLDRYVCQRDDSNAPLMAYAKECDGAIKDFTAAVRIEGVEEDTLIAAYLL